jgi:hypothetical protein
MSERPVNKPDFLARRGGWMLVGWGVVLVALACIFAGEATIASIFAFTGVAIVVLGVLAARFEGDFELTAMGLKGKLLAVAEREDLTLEDKGDEMVRLVEREVGGHRQLPAVEQGPRLDPSTGMRRYLAFEDKVMEWFRANGWSVERVDHRAAGDFIAKRNGATRLVEVKARSRISTADIRQIVGKAILADHPEYGRDFKVVLAVPAGSLTKMARDAALTDQPGPFEIMELAEDA